eukprot:6944588-Pyramimonas_sp.AAC.1
MLSRTYCSGGHGQGNTVDTLFPQHFPPNDQARTSSLNATVEIRLCDCVLHELERFAFTRP